MNTQYNASSWRFTALQLALAGMVWSPVLPAFAAPAQMPLFMRAAKTIAPNIMLTFDDSGSMSWSHLPDSQWPYTVTPVMHPNDPEGYVYKCLAPSSGTDYRFLQLRSPAFNKAYYDPTIYYRPWAKADGTDAPKASYTAAATQPAELVTGASLSSTINLSTTYTGFRAPWCVASNNNARYYYTGSQQDTQVCDANNDTKCTAMAFNPGIYYRFIGNVDSSSSYTNTANYKLVDLNGTATDFNSVTLEKHQDRVDCAGAKCTLNEERANFANWFTYYRNRNFIAKAGVSRAFGMQTKEMRVGYGQINLTSQAAELSSVPGAPTSTIKRGVRDFSRGSATRQEFFTWLYGVDASGGTPLRRAMDDVGKYYSIKGDVGPWGNNPGVNTSLTRTAQTNQKACRKSYHILTTDGYWNGSGASTADAQLNVDSIKGPEIKNKEGTKVIYQYDPSKITRYKDGGTGTLADIAMYYWNRDLHPDLDNRVPPSPNSKYDAANNVDTGDHAVWQHMTTFTVGLGVLGSVKNTSEENTPPVGGWPVPPTDGNDLRTVDDLWHAAVNGRGTSLQATRPNDFADALAGFLEEINAAQVPVTNTSFSSFVLSGSSKRYKPSYDMGTWTGKFEAFKATDGSQAQPIWDASKVMPTPENRLIVSWKQSSKSPVNFFSGAIDSAAADWGGTSPTADLINFLRGDRTKEGNGFRCRGGARGTTKCTDIIEKNLGRLGDIVNSKAILIKNGVDLDYQNLPKSTLAGFAGRGSYRKHVATKKERSDGLVFIGANDGMLHAFLDSTGVEKFAYVPYAVYGNLGRLAQPNYGDEDTTGLEHRYFVDGPLAETDAYINGNWNNLVVGSAGGGAKAVFAVRVPTSSPVPSMSTSDLLLEYNSSSENGTKLGYVTQPIAVGPTPNGNWVAVFGNGLDSADGKAYLIALDLATGKATAVAAGTDNDKGLGLGGVTLIRNEERVIIGAYAGDYAGRLWRFDLDASGWKVGFGGKPLFDAGSGKPISAAPAYFAHPNGTGVMVLFGTGSLYAEGDQDSTAGQTLYGIWDQTPVSQLSSADQTVTTDKLVEQKFTDSETVGDKVFIKSTQNSIAWTGTDAKRGWYLNLTLQAGLRNIYTPQFVDRYSFFSTVAPKGAGDDCEGTQSVAYNIFIDALTGGMPPKAIMDTNKDGLVNSNDLTASTFKNSTGQVGQPEVVANPFDPNNNPDGGNFEVFPGPTGDGEGQKIQAPGGFTQRHWRLISTYPGQNAQAPKP